MWYFGYGSNLDPRTFLGRRRMHPTETVAARLDGWRLAFDLPIGPGERGVANLVCAPGARVLGVAYHIHAEQARRLDRTEGVPRAYRRLRVRLLADGDRELQAFTYVSRLHVPDRKPSRRYLGLLLHGARHHDLPASWIQHLRTFELARDERDPPQE